MSTKLTLSQRISSPTCSNLESELGHEFPDMSITLCMAIAAEVFVLPPDLPVAYLKKEMKEQCCVWVLLLIVHSVLSNWSYLENKRE